MTREEIEAKVLDDYEFILGKTLEISQLTGFVADEQVDIDATNVPVLVRVVKTGRDSLLRWMDSGKRQDCVDPCWDIDLLTGEDEMPPGFRASWMFGTSYHLDGTIEPFRGIVIPPGIHARCPNDASHREFLTVATVMQDWRVDETGNFIACVNDAIETVSRPDTGNTWACAKCHEIAYVVEVG